MAFPDSLSGGEAYFPFVLSLLQLWMSLSSEPPQSPSLLGQPLECTAKVAKERQKAEGTLLCRSSGNYFPKVF